MRLAGTGSTRLQRFFSYGPTGFHQAARVTLQTAHVIDQCWFNRSDVSVLDIGKDGMVASPKIVLHPVATLARGRLGIVHGIVVHQTGGATAEAAFAGYASRPYGTHFLIDKSGTIYQTASLLYYTAHVGPIKSRCLVEHRCSPVDLKALATFSPRSEGRRELLKPFPARYPGNHDSVGVELVGEVDRKTGEFVTVTDAQNRSLHWLVQELAMTLHVSMQEIYRHPQLSRKTPSEASTARW